MELIKAFFCQKTSRAVVKVPGDETVRCFSGVLSVSTMDTSGGTTYGSNSWMTLSNLKTENSLVEKAEREKGSFEFVLVEREEVSGWRSYRGRLPWTE